jgi:hypothetical protein
MQEIALNSTMNFFGLEINVGPNEMLMILLGLLLLIGLFVIIVTLRKHLG